MRVWFFTLVICMSVASGCAQKIQESAFLMNTNFSVTLYPRGSESKARSDIQAAFDLIRNLELQFSTTIDDSMLSELNATGSAEFSPEGLRILKACFQFHRQTDGAFDPSVYPLVRLWGFQTTNQRVPTLPEIKKALGLVGLTRVVRLKGTRVSLERGSGLDFGGVLKGYAVDQALELLRSKGHQAGLVNAGGNLRVFGEKPGRSPWVIGIRHPRQEGEVIALVSLKDGQAIATSGDYERYFTQNHNRYHHMIDPFTGSPAQNGMVSVSVIAPDALTADAFSTGLFVLGPHRAFQTAEALAFPLLIITSGKETLSLSNNSLWIHYEAR